MKKIITWIKNHLNYLKIIFIASVIVLIIAELMSIGKTISIDQLSEIFGAIPFWRLILMLLIGLLAVTPTFGYDLVLNKLLKTNSKLPYILETSWTINSLNNMIGFGGVISIGLRSTFYGEKANGKQVAQAMSKILVFLMSGLSIFSFISFLYINFGSVNDYLKQYWIWLLGGSLYFPIVLLVTKFRKDQYIGDISAKTKTALVLTSFLEWLGVAASFLLIGRLMGIHTHLLQVVPLLIAATIIGICSLIPGEIGSFDVMMIIGLSALGIERSQAVAWILLYRLFYYIIPFLIGVVLFIRNFSTALNQRYSGIPHQLTTEIAHKIVVFLMYVSGISLVLTATIPEAFAKYHFLRDLNPFSIHIISQFPAVLLGFILIILGRGISAKVKRAYFPTISVLLVALVYMFFKDFSYGMIIFFMLLLSFIIFSKNELYREQLVYSWEMKTVDGLIFSALTILYIAIGVYNLPTFPHYKKHFISFLAFPSEKTWFSGLLAVIVVFLFIIVFLRYLEGKKHKIGEAVDLERVQKLLTTYGGNADSQLVFLGDKEMYVYQDENKEDTVLFQYKTYSNRCVIMGDPSGKKTDFRAAIKRFSEEMDQWGYQPLFYEVSEDVTMLMHEFGYEFIKIGEEAWVNLVDFTLTGKKMKAERAEMNKFARDNYAFKVIEPPFTDDFMKQLKVISDEWLGSRKEKGFSLGYFSEEYLSRAPIAIAENGDGRIVAFATIMPTYTKEQGTIDLMRYNKETPSGVMDYLFISLFSYMKNQGIDYFNLGMAPLSNVGTSQKSFLTERVAYLVYEFGSHFYSFQGLRSYKEKYASKWVSRYTLYARDSSIIYAMIILLIIDNAPVQDEQKLHGLKRIINLPKK